MSFPFIIRQRTFPGRTVVLQGRSLPYQGVEWGGTQRLDVNWFPGNPVAVVQVIGQTYKPTRITGTWKDVFLFDLVNSAKLINFPALQRAATPGANERGGNTFQSMGSVPAQEARRARALRDAMEMLRREGILLQVEWGSIVRFGFLSETNFTHDREEDIGYEIEFTWMGDTDAQPTPIPDLGLDVLSLLKQLFALLAEIINTLLTAIFEAQKFIQLIQSTINKLASFVTELLAALNTLASFVFAPFDVIGNIRANLTAIKLAALDFQATVRNASAAVIASVTGNPIAISLAQLLQKRLRRQVQVLAAFAAVQETKLAQQQTTELKGIYTSPGGVTLRDVSAKFFDGNPDNWRRIADFNGLNGSVLPAGTIVRVPKV